MCELKWYREERAERKVETGGVLGLAALPWPGQARPGLVDAMLPCIVPPTVHVLYRDTDLLRITTGSLPIDVRWAREGASAGIGSPARALDPDALPPASPVPAGLQQQHEGFREKGLRFRHFP